MSKPDPAKAGDALLYRPINRPPVLQLCVLDDGLRDNGEWHRIRAARFVIGRTEGDLVIPHDDAISSKHCEILRRVHEGRQRFYLKDLNSTNGTFVRVAKATLKPGQEVFLGASRYTFNPGGAGEVAEEESPPVRNVTRGWKAVSAADISRMVASLEEVGSAGQPRRLLLNDAENVLGSDPAKCSLLIAGDPFVSPTHARIHKDGEGRWRIEHLSSLNGLWVRVTEVPLENNGEFQLGEQRFLVRLL